jgi:tRNA modification GTPase
MQPNDTICALSSGHGRAGVAVLRISGPAAAAAVRALCGDLPAPRYAALRPFKHPESGELLDRGLLLWFAEPASFTGEDMAELHCHGSRAVLQAIVDALLGLGLRLAEPGEFAFRAFERGKLDLTEIEGLSDLINAETEAQRRQALAQSQGALGRLYENWRRRLLQTVALVEAELDFADESDVPESAARQAEALATQLLADIETHLADRRGERLRDGFRVVIAGAPNAGKSSLLNALSKRDVAIVSEEAGTTRDVIEVHLDLVGLPVIVSDTAGIREAGGGVEAEGIRRALARAGDADLVLWIIDAQHPEEKIPSQLMTSDVKIIRIRNKIDLAPERGGKGLSVSAKTGENLSELVALLTARAETALAGGAEASVVTRARHRTELEHAQAALKLFLEVPASLELKAEELRLAATHLGRLTGRIDVEQVLGQIFSEFCIGK